MRYQGGKSRLGKKISSILKEHRKDGQVYLEPFVGSAAVIEHMDGMRIGNDYFHPLIALYHKLQGGWQPFHELSKQEYDDYRYNTEWTPENIHLKAYVGIGCSFGGKLWGGYARGENRNFCDELARGLLKQLPKIQEVMFTSIDYKRLNPSGMLIYCDAPYKDTTGYKETPEFDHDEYWTTLRKWAKNNTVFVSEYQAPDDNVEVVWTKEVKTTLTQKQNTTNDRVEKLYLVS